MSSAEISTTAFTLAAPDCSEECKIFSGNAEKLLNMKFS
jgi:hypothetical protein